MAAANNYVVFITFISFANSLPLEDDAKKVASDIQLSKDKMPDLLAAAAKHAVEKFGSDKFGSDNFGGEKDDEGFFKTHDTKSDDGYKKLGKFAKKDGDTYGFEEHSVYGKKGGGDKNKNMQYHHTTSYDIDDSKKKDGDESDKPSFREWHFESNSKSPSKNVKTVFEDEDGDDEAVDEEFAAKNRMAMGGNSKKIKRSKKPHPDVEITGHIFGPKFQSLGDMSPGALRRQKESRKTKREKKDPALSATDDLNYYDDGDDAAFAGLEDGEEEAEGADYDEYPENEADDYY